MRKSVGYIVVWQGRPMRDSAPSSLYKGERGCLFTGGRSATIYPTLRTAQAALRLSVRSWDKKKFGKAQHDISERRQWWTVRLVTPWRAKA